MFKKIILGLVLIATAFPCYSELDNFERSFVHALLFNLDSRSALNMLIASKQYPEKFSQEFTDIVAEVNVQEARDASSKKRVVRLLSKSLLKLNNPRYDQALLAVLDAPGYDDITIRRSINARKDKGKHYVPGTVNLNALRDKFINDAFQKVVSPEKVDYLKKIPIGSPVSLAYEVLGPSDASKTKPKRLELFYREGVHVRVVINKGVAEVEDIKFNRRGYITEMPFFDAKNNSSPFMRHVIMHLVVHGSVWSLRTIAKPIVAGGSVDPLIADVYAEKLRRAEKKGISNKHAGKYAWAIKVVGLSDSDKFTPLLKKFAKSDNKKLQKAASKVLKAKGVIETDSDLGRGIASYANMKQLKSKYKNMFPKEALQFES